MAKKNKENTEAAFKIPIFTPENRNKFDELYEKYKKQGAIALAAIAILLIGYYVYKNVYLERQNELAYSLMFYAEKYLEVDSFQLALDGNIQNDEYGFIDIIDEFGMTDAGKLANHYAGICYLNLGQPEEALDHLKKYNLNSEEIRSANLGLRGDAYSQMQEYEEAASLYIKAAEYGDNELTTPYFYWKAGLHFEELGEYEKALEVYQIVKDEYPKSNEGNKIDRYIGRTEGKLAQ